jgi:hypothetical protein
MACIHPLRTAVWLACLTLVASCTIGKVKHPKVDVAYLSELEQDVLAEINLARTAPGDYAAYVAAWRPYFEYKRLTLPGKEPVRTAEGVAAVDDAVRFLEGAAAVGPLNPSRGMSAAARDHVTDMGPIGAIGHLGMDGSDTDERLSRYGDWASFKGETIGEVICYGPTSAREIVIQLIVDDGVPSRAHRATLFEPTFRFAGVSCGPHAQFGSFCVVTFASNYIDS